MNENLYLILSALIANLFYPLKAQRIEADQEMDNLLKKITDAEHENEVTVLLCFCSG